MAVAAHIGRVASDYPPSGYSVSRRIVIEAEDAIGGVWPGGKWEPWLYADDGEFWVEAIEVLWPNGYPGGDPAPAEANCWHVDVVAMDPVAQTKSEDMVHIETANFSAAAGDHFSVVDPAVGGGPPFLGHYVQPGAFLGLFIDRLDDGAGGPAADLQVSFHIRYRVKA